MAETIGTLVDKLSIVELRRWHTEEIMLDPAAPVELRHECALRLRVIDDQRADLMDELAVLWDAISSGRYRPKVYRQLKMYNDPRMRRPTDEEACDGQADDGQTDDDPDDPTVVTLRSAHANVVPLRRPD